jgi:hypothetical protein
MPTAEIIQLAILGVCVLAAVSMSIICLRNSPRGKYLCEDCKYNDPAMCGKKDRPKAVDCLSYMRKDKPADPSKT